MSSVSLRELCLAKVTIAGRQPVLWVSVRHGRLVLTQQTDPNGTEMSDTLPIVGQRPNAEETGHG